MRRFFSFITLVLLITSAAGAQDSERPTGISSDFCYGISGGVGAMIPTGGISDIFKSSAVFQVGLTGGYNDFRLKADVLFAQPSIKKANVFERYLPEGKPAYGNAHADVSFLGLAAQVGYRVWERGNIAITPNAGVIYTKYSWDLDSLKWGTNDEGKEIVTPVGTRKAKLHSWGFMASVDIDFKLHNSFVDPLDMGNRHRYTSVLRLSPFVATANYNQVTPHARGCVVGITLNYMGLLQPLW